MTREEQIAQASIEYTMQRNPMCLGGDNFYNQVQMMNRNYAFEAGAKWADEHPDLSSLWHDPSEEPQGDSEILFDGLGYSIIYDLESDLYDSEIDWKEFVKEHYIQRWAYIKDLQPSDNVPSNVPSKQRTINHDNE